VQLVNKPIDFAQTLPPIFVVQLFAIQGFTPK